MTTSPRPDASSPADPPAARASGKRLAAIDIARGVFMVLIIASHTARTLADVPGVPRLHQVLHFVLSGRIGFITISGMLIGYFAATRVGADLDRIRARYRTQAIRLLLFVHLLITIARAGEREAGISWWEYFFRVVYLTDILAVLFLLVVPVVLRTGPVTRLWLGCLLALVARALWAVPVEQPALVLLRDLLFGPGSDNAILLYSYPLLSMAGFFLIGSFFGHQLALAEREGWLEWLSRWFRLAVVPLGLLSVALVAAYVAVRRVPPPGGADYLRRALYPDYYLSLYPAYLGVALALVGLLISRREVGPVGRFFMVFGKSSLFTYVAQYYVVETIPHALGWKAALSPAECAALYVVSLGVLWVLALGWLRYVKKV